MTYKLIAPDGTAYQSPTPGTLGGHRKLKIFGRLDCPSALRFIARGHYVKHRVFFADRTSAIAAGYRPCAKCLPNEYKVWKAQQTESSAQRWGLCCFNQSPQNLSKSLQKFGDLPKLPPAHVTARYVV
jgi:methylphosphotriester-DNA--protein-cysteine methyltransferase